MRKAVTLTSTIVLFMLIFLFPAKTSEAVEITYYSGVHNSTYIVPYGNVIGVKAENGETIASDDSSKGKLLEDGRMQIIGVGEFDLTVTKSDGNKEKIKFFGWNAFLREGKYAAYSDEKRNNKAGEINARMYIALEKTNTSDSLKILDHLNLDGEKSNSINGKYITSYYNPEKDASETRNYEYSFVVSPLETGAPETPGQTPDPGEQDGEYIKIKLNSKYTQNVTEESLNWNAENEDIIEVIDANKGIVRGIRVGKVNFIGKSGNKQKQVVKIHVYRPDGFVLPIEKIVLDKTEVELEKDEKLLLQATITPKYADNRKLKWMSSNESVAGVSNRGKIIARSGGKATIKVINEATGVSAKCEVTVKTGKPIYQYSYSGDKVKEYKDDSIYVKIEKASGYNISKIWVKDPGNQVKKAEAGFRVTVKSVKTMLNATKGAIVGCNGSGFLTSSFKADGSSDSGGLIRKYESGSKYYNTPEGYIVITDGKTHRNFGTSNVMIGILPNGSLKYYEASPYSEVIADGVTNTFTFGPLIMQNGEKYTQKVGKLRKTFTQTRHQSIVGQVDENNFILLTTTGGAKKSLNNAYDMGKKLNCKLLFNFDGGGSATLWFRGGTTGDGGVVNGAGGRSVADALYFKSLK